MTESSKRNSSDNMKVEVFVKPNAKKNGIVWDSDLKKYIISVKSPPTKGKANYEAISLLKNYFKAERVILEKGATSPTKIFTLAGIKNKELIVTNTKT